MIESYARGPRIALNPAPMNNNISLQSMALADWLILNETEAQELTGLEEPFAQPGKLSKRFPGTAILLTLGARGVRYSAEGQTFSFGSCKVELVDTTAAGDTFVGFFLSTLLETGDPARALLTATRSALAVSRNGAGQSIPTLQQVEKCDLEPQPFK